MIKLFLIILFIFLVFHFSTKSYLNPYKLILVFGKKGSGKTTFLTKQAIKHSKKGWKIYSNFYLPNSTQVSDKDIGTIHIEPGSLLLIDEVGMIWDNRNFRDFKTEVRDWFKLQRQYKVKVIMCSQAFDIDKKLRDLTDEMYLLGNFLRVFSICRRISKSIKISNNSNSDDKNSTNNGGALIEHYQFIGLPSFTFIPRYVEYFKSFNPKELPKIEREFIEYNEIQKQLLSTKVYYQRKITKIINLFILQIKNFSISLFNKIIKIFNDLKNKN